MFFDECDKPEEPSQEDCCQSGCTPCVFDIYKAQVKQWEEYCRYSNFVRNDVLSQTRFKPFILKNITKLTLNTNLYKFQPFTDNSKTFGVLPFKSGQHLVLRLNGGNEKIKAITRAYTIITNNEEKENCSFLVLIKLYGNGIMSNYINSLNKGDITHWRGPYGDFIYEPNKYNKILMICIGTGIAPMYSIIQDILNNENDETVVTLMYGCRNTSEIILREELYKLSSFWNFSYTCYLSEGYSSSNKKYTETFIDGKISKEHIESYIKLTIENIQFLVCGNTDFSDQILKILIDCKVLKTNIHVF